jgi:hypothetical protein
MSIILDDSIFVGQQKANDAKYDNDGAGWTSVAQVNSILSVGVRYPGLFVYVVNKKYIYKDGIADLNLIEEVSASIIEKTSDITLNDGADGTSYYVEFDEISAVAISNDYNDLDNKPTPVDITNKVDKVEGERLINAPEIEKLAYQSGTNTGDETLASIQAKLVSTTNLTEGTNLYFTTARVLATLLSGVSFLTGGVITATDSILIAFGKLQNQISDNALTYTNFGTFISNASAKNVLVDADQFSIVDSVTGLASKFSWLKMKEYFATVFQTKTQLITTATTATNGSKYIASGTFIITDFTGVQGNWYEVIVRN